MASANTGIGSTLDSMQRTSTEDQSVDWQGMLNLVPNSKHRGT